MLSSSLPMLRAVGASAGRAQMLRGVDAAGGVGGAGAGGAGGNGHGNALGLLKVWFALEARTFVTSSVDQVESLVKYDLLSPNI